MGKKLNGFCKGTKAVMKALGEGFLEGCARYEELHPAEPPIVLQTDVTLKAEDLRQLKGMSFIQLEKIFKNKTVHLADDPDVYMELKNFNSLQLDAIFGKEGN